MSALLRIPMLCRCGRLLAAHLAIGVWFAHLAACTQPRNFTGVACEDNDPCASGWYCSLVAGGGVCAPSADNGAACTESRECASNKCDAGTCQRCYWDTDCLSDQYCTRSGNGGIHDICLSLRPVGSECSRAGECGRDGVDLTCVDRRCELVPRLCERDADCEDGSFCLDSGQCVSDCDVLQSLEILFYGGYAIGSWSASAVDYRREPEPRWTQAVSNVEARIVGYSRFSQDAPSYTTGFGAAFQFRRTIITIGDYFEMEFQLRDGSCPRIERLP